MAQYYPWVLPGEGGVIPALISRSVAFTQVDGDVICQNWNKIFSLVNGNLAFCNVWRDCPLWSEFDFILTERGPAQDVEVDSSPRGIQGIYHNHDGYSSAFIGDDAIERSELASAYTSMVCSGSASRTGVLLHGSVASKSTLYTGTQVYFALPWDHIRFPASGSDRIPMGNAGFCKAISCPIVPDANTMTHNLLFSISCVQVLSGAAGYLNSFSVSPVFAQQTYISLGYSFVLYTLGALHG